MIKQKPAIDTKWLYVLIGVAVLVNLSGLFVPVIGPDGTLYACIAKTMAQTNNFVNLYAYGQDWLDKPHFPFWVTALSFQIFGISSWAYKLPGVLFMLMGAYYTYLFGKALYHKQIGLWATVILLTAQHIVLSNYDVRAEPYLTGLVIASVYHLYQSHTKNSYLQLLWGCLFAACAIMTKGIFAIAPIGGAIAGNFIITKQWKQLFSLRWLVAIVLTAIFILPELYCLYQQFDLHPEKLIFGRHGISGIRFFFWDSQFGRFFNTGPIKGHGDPSFFIHTTLWAFLPWSVVLFTAIYQFIKKGINKVGTTEWYCLSGSLLTFLLFSASQFQLPHYLNIVYPFFAIITAQYLYNVQQLKSVKAIRLVQCVVAGLMVLMMIVLNYLYQPETWNFPVVLCLLLLAAALIYLPHRITRSTVSQMLVLTLLVSFFVNIYLNTIFYKSLLKYQAGSQAALWINRNVPENLQVVQLNDEYVSSFSFYIAKPVITITDDNPKNYPKGPFILYATKQRIRQLGQLGWSIKPLRLLERYWVSRLKLKFLNKATRSQELTEMQIVYIDPGNVKK